MRFPVPILVHAQGSFPDGAIIIPLSCSFCSYRELDGSNRFLKSPAFTEGEIPPPPKCRVYYEYYEIIALSQRGCESVRSRVVLNFTCLGGSTRKSVCEKRMRQSWGPPTETRGGGVGEKHLFVVGAWSREELLGDQYQDLPAEIKTARDKGWLLNLCFGMRHAFYICWMPRRRFEAYWAIQ